MNSRITRRKRRNDVHKPAFKLPITQQAKRDRAIAFQAALEILG
jgi:hypothetical protein